jgi:Domain of unknown function (DUF4160)
MVPEISHFPLRYAGASAAVEIGTLAVMSGTVPPRVLGLVVEWASIHRSELLLNWEAASEGRRLRRIAPLE